MRSRGASTASGPGPGSSRCLRDWLPASAVARHAARRVRGPERGRGAGGRADSPRYRGVQEFRRHRRSSPAPPEDAARPVYSPRSMARRRLDRERTQRGGESGMPVVAGDRLRTEGGRARVTFPDGTRRSSRSLQRTSTSPSDNVLRLSRGRLLATVFESVRERVRASDRRSAGRRRSASTSPASTGSRSAATDLRRSGAGGHARLARSCRARTGTSR